MHEMRQTEADFNTGIFIGTCICVSSGGIILNLQFLMNLVSPGALNLRIVILKETNTYYSPFFLKFRPRAKFSSKIARALPGDIRTGKTGEISFARFYNKRLNELELLQVNRLLTERRVRVNITLTPCSILHKYFWSRVKDTNNIPLTAATSLDFLRFSLLLLNFKQKCASLDRASVLRNSRIHSHMMTWIPDRTFSYCFAPPVLGPCGLTVASLFSYWQSA